MSPCLLLLLSLLSHLFGLGNEIFFCVSFVCFFCRIYGCYTFCIPVLFFKTFQVAVLSNAQDPLGSGCSRAQTNDFTNQKVFTRHRAGLVINGVLHKRSPEINGRNKNWFHWGSHPDIWSYFTLLVTDDFGPTL